MLDALEDLQIDVKKHKAENPPKPEFFQYDLQDCTFDLLPKLNTPAKFIEAYMRREVFTRNGVEISVIGYNDLIKHKLALGRPKDLEDIENLKRIKPPGIS
ncbi:hypothetical protein DYBT9275_05217 [Dyadobacter sp. CECT 9275]|uniref:Uncharacterized protein n=1 Tax=Dyadobacter helix TaxID=2822344 RepID=A0A916JI11_9BACT|nr:hypothetical protein [Dyadobacter sp. CECT 9275]CAG5012642.1 hypothetical protein DYBT9275_05217 [Dyadobacter sp. CECT 9275]